MSIAARSEGARQPEGPRLAPRTPEVLAPFVEAGVLDAAETHLAATVVRLHPEVADEVLLGLAVAARGPRLGHVCVELADVARQVVGRGVDDVVDAAGDLPWPETRRWIRALERSDLVAAPGEAGTEPLRPLVWDGRRLYLQRYWHHERTVEAGLRARATAADPTPQGDLAATLDALFGGEDPSEPDLQRRAAAVALTRRLAVIAGGPGTGKTRTVARLLAAAQRMADAVGRPLEVALAAPTGKAAARMTEAVHTEVAAATHDGAISAQLAARLSATEATTVHRLLGWVPGIRLQHDRHDPLAADLVVVDETSMVSLPLMARLLDAVRPSARLVLVGDPHQLASVEAGTVMSDVVGPAGEPHATATTGTDAPAPATASGAPLAGRVTVLRRARRFAADSGIAAVADAVRAGDADRALELLDDGTPDTRWVRDDDPAGLAAIEELVIDAAAEVVSAALAGDAAAGLGSATKVKVLAAMRRRPLGLGDWSVRIEQGVARRRPDLDLGRRWYAGRPVIVTANDPLNKVANGDVGLVVRRGAGVAVAFDPGGALRYVAPSRLDRVETWWAMTIHKSQGSEFHHAVVSLPSAESPVLTRELLYTAVTRARAQVTVIGGEPSLRAAIGQPIARASGLRDRLWPPAPTDPGRG